MTRPTVALPALALGAVLVLTGCGGGGSDSDSGPTSSGASSSSSAPEQPSVGELYEQVRTASLAAESGHLEGYVTDNGERLDIEIEGRADGSNQRAAVTVGDGQAVILSVGSENWMSGDADFWQEQTGDATAAKALVGKFVAISPADAKDIGDLTLGSLLEQMFQDEGLSALDKLTSSVETRSEGGQDYWVASDGSGSEIWVDPADRTLAKITAPGDSGGELAFDKWDAAKTFKAPPASKVVSP
jgi:hypothetical protein